MRIILNLSVTIFLSVSNDGNHHYTNYKDKVISKLFITVVK